MRFIFAFHFVFTLCHTFCASYFVPQMLLFAFATKIFWLHNFCCTYFLPYLCSVFLLHTLHSMFLLHIFSDIWWEVKCCCLFLVHIFTRWNKASISEFNKVKKRFVVIICNIVKAVCWLNMSNIVFNNLFTFFVFSPNILKDIFDIPQILSWGFAGQQLKLVWPL